MAGLGVLEAGLGVLESGLNVLEAKLCVLEAGLGVLEARLDVMEAGLSCKNHSLTAKSIPARRFQKLLEAARSSENRFFNGFRRLGCTGRGKGFAFLYTPTRKAERVDSGAFLRRPRMRNRRRKEFHPPLGFTAGFGPTFFYF